MSCVAWSGNKVSATAITREREASVVVWELRAKGRGVLVVGVEGTVEIGLTAVATAVEQGRVDAWGGGDPGEGEGCLEEEGQNEERCLG